MLWGGREAACRARQLLLRVLPPRGLRLLLLLLRWGELRVPYLQVPPLLGRDGRRDVEILLELRHKICFLGVLPPPDDHLRPLLPLVRLPRGWRCRCVPRVPRDFLGLPDALVSSLNFLPIYIDTLILIIFLNKCSRLYIPPAETS